MSPPRPTGSKGAPRPGLVDAPRRVAYDVLQAVSNRDAYANLVLPASITKARLDARDAAFATELTYGTLRWLGTYDAVIEHCVNRKPAELDSTVLSVLRLGAHQLFTMNVPAHAAVATSVDLVAEVVGRKPTGLVNAVMRRMSHRPLEHWLEELAPGVSLTSLAIRYSHPAWIVEEFGAVLPDVHALIDLLEADNRAPAVSLVARSGRTTVTALVDRGAQPGRWAPTAATLPSGDPGTIPEVRDGSAGVQDEGSQLVALALAHVPLKGRDEQWLDLCAGPGGKAALLGAIGDRCGARLTAVEIREHRARLVRDIVSENVDVVVGDGTDTRWATGEFDRVLVDVPCSGLGALRRRPESRWRKSYEDLRSLRPLQDALLSNALGAVRPGGVVAYVTCSPVPGETREVVDAALERFDEFSLMDARPLLPGVPRLGDGPDLQLWPHLHDTDAMYLALIRRDGPPDPTADALTSPRQR